MRPVTKTQGNLVISSLNSDCECWFPLFFYGSARRRRAELSQEMWRHLQFVWMCFDISWSLIFRVTFSESFLWHKLKHNFRQRGSRLATLSLAQGLVQAHERPPKFCSCTHQAPHAGSCERSVPPPTSGHLQRAGRPCRPGAEAKDVCKAACFPESAPEPCLGRDAPAALICKLTVLVQRARRRVLAHVAPEAAEKHDVEGTDVRATGQMNLLY